MNDKLPLILAIGAAGRFAGLVVPELAIRGARVRGFVRDATQTGTVIERGATEVAVGDLRDRKSLDAALKRCSRRFLYCARLPARRGRGRQANGDGCGKSPRTTVRIFFCDSSHLGRAAESRC